MVKDPKPNLITVDLTATIEEVSDVLAKEDVNLVVVTAKGKHVGIISTKDTSRESGSGKRPSERYAFEIMTSRKDVITTSPNGNLSLVSQAMTEGEKEIRHIIVADEFGEWIAVLSIKDILRAMRLNEQEREEIQEMYAKSGWPPVS